MHELMHGTVIDTYFNFPWMASVLQTKGGCYETNQKTLWQINRFYLPNDVH
eukprot:m.188680 g.188680  ORF g.188680 m.188680 type:complete len:51 (+) comp39393_c1_seq9:303-455(+)